MALPTDPATSKDPILLTSEEVQLIADEQFFRAKAVIMRKVRGMLDAMHVALQEEVGKATLLAPTGFDPTKHQLVKGESLEDCPYQYLDYPKHFVGREKFTFRSLFWWGHHFAFALILEGEQLPRYKRNVLDRYYQVADRNLDLSLAPTPWEWKRGEGYTIPVNHDRKAQVAAVLAERPFFKVARFVPLDDPFVVDGRVAHVCRETFRTLLLIVSS